MVDETPQLAGDEDWAGFNRGRNTWVGGVTDDGTNTSWAHNTSPGFGVSMARAGVEKYVFTAHAGAPPAGSQVSLRMPNSDATTIIWHKWRTEKLPLLRC